MPAIAALICVVLGAAACTSSSPAPAPAASTCHWPATSSPATAGLALVERSAADGDHLDAYDVRTGRQVGTCTIHGPVAASSALEIGGTIYGSRGYHFSVPPVAGTDVHLVPDNISGSRGGVRDLHSGTHDALRFDGWQVVSTIGTRLLLRAGRTGSVAPRSPAQWCVLPSVADPRSACAAIPGARGAGIATVTPTGAVSWVPDAGVPARVGGIAGSLATGGGSVTAFGPGTPTTSRSSPEDPVAVDQRTVVFVPAAGSPAPGGHGSLQWATVRVGASGVTSVVHDSGTSTLPGSGTAFDNTQIAGLATSPDGSRLVVLTFGGDVYDFGTAGHARKITTLRTGRSVAVLRLVSWPPGVPAT